MENNKLLAYLDHNILDLMTKGDPHKVKNLLKKCKVTPVYSNETLIEIQRSIGYETNFLELLDEIGAKYIDPVLDQSFKQTGCANIHSVSPKACYKNFLANQKQNPDGNFGLSEISMKLYGGNEEISYADICQQGAADLQKYLLDTLEGIDDLPLSEFVDVDSLKSVIVDLPEIMKDQSITISEKLDNKPDSPVFAFEKELGLGPRVLNNVSPPNVVDKIWKIVSEKLGEQEIDMETFFGVKPHAFEADYGKERTLQEKVNAIYHQLNFLGYYRDSNIKKERRFKASFSDMTHAGVASFCHLFLCRDKNLVRKAAATYEYLGVQTKILHYQANKDI